MNISHTLLILCNIMLVYSLINTQFSCAYKKNLPKKGNNTLKNQIQTPKIIVKTSLLPKKWNDNNNKNDNTTSVRININPDPLIPDPLMADSSSRAHLISMLFI